ncbi:hypothetical protein HMPREF3156_00341 [Neisseria sp. HMSC06F02]|nr:hypothetical protein HMPREF3156_00341 [Neisseria sp. HMSC06F02]
MSKIWGPVQFQTTFFLITSLLWQSHNITHEIKILPVALAQKQMYSLPAMKTCFKMTANTYL